MPLQPSSDTGKTVSLTVDSTSGGVSLAASDAKTSASVAIITVFSNPIRYTKDGTAPTTTLGHYATDKDVIVLRGQSQISNFKAIREGSSSATLIVSYYVGDADEVDRAILQAGLLSAGTRQLSAATPIQGVAAGYKVARGQRTTVAASDTVVTGLTTVVAVVATLDDDPVAGCQFASASIGDQAGTPAAGSILVKTWKATAAGDTAVIAATTFTKKVNWVAVGT